VYRARDTKVGRDAALKILPDLFTQDPDRLARFKREAQIVASLNHPNIADDSEVVYVSDSGSHANLWATNLLTGESRQLTSERDPDRRIGLPLWSPDRRLIADFVALGFLVRILAKFTFEPLDTRSITVAKQVHDVIGRTKVLKCPLRREVDDNVLGESC
jgi:serine/threonine protein kinase